MRNNLYICNANPQTKTTLISHICGSNFGTHYIFAGVMYPDIKDEFEHALEVVYDNGASGIAFFAEPDEEHLRMLKSYMDEHGLMALH